MTDELWTRVDEYLCDLLVATDSPLRHTLETSEAAGLPAIHVSPNLGKLLGLFAQMQGARSILEIGTLGGYSTIWLARALPPGGELITLEADPHRAEVAQGNIAAAGLAETVEVRPGPALTTLPTLVEDSRSPFDFIFIDADKANTAEYFSWALRLSRRGSLIVVDNVVRNGDFIDSKSNDENIQGMRSFLQQLAAEPRVSATAVQTVGVKGYDGFVIAWVIGESPDAT